MKPFKTIRSICLSAFALFLVASCTKTVDVQLAKGDRDAEQLIHQQCGNFIGLRMKDPNGYFWYGTENNKQSFNGNNFTPSNFMKVTASTNGLNPSITSVSPNFAANAERLGVFSNVDIGQEPGRINVGEVLILKLGSNFLPSGFAFYGFDLQINSSKNVVGKIDLYRKGVKVNTVNFVSGIPLNSNFPVTHRVANEKWFDEMRFYPTVGAFQLNGAGRNLNNIWLPPVKFYMIDLPNNVFLNTNSNSNPFINTVINGVSSPIADRQTRDVTIAAGLAGSGNFNNAGSINTKLWLNLSAGANSLVWFSRLAIRSTGVPPNEGGSINPGETLSVKAGPSLAYTLFRTVEVRVAHMAGTNNPLTVTLYKNNVAVSTPANTNGINGAYNVFSGTQDFDEVRITGTGVGAGIGRPGLSLRLFRGCF